MANIFTIVFAALVLQVCISAAPNSGDDTIRPAVEENTKIEQGDPNGELQEESEAAKVTSEQSQRQKRFYDYFDIDTPHFIPNNPNYIKRDYSQDTGVYGSQDFMLQILRRVQTILSYTRQQAFSPPVAHYPVPSFIPFYYLPRVHCDCTPATPGAGEDSSSDARPTQPTTATSPDDSTTQRMTPANEPETSSSENPNKTTMDFTDRFGDMNDEELDGDRPISFVPLTPKTPLRKPPPKVEHGSVQESSGGVTAAPSEPPVAFTGFPAQPHLPTNAIPTLCDGAVLVCCHRAEVTYDCFKSQGCPNPSSPNTPCNEKLILKVINKFQYYYANRRG